MNRITDEKMKLWIERKLNVLIRGPHGVGKTTRILNLFKEMGIRYKYYSGSTLDAFEFSGIPVKETDAEGNHVIKHVLPKVFTEDVQVIFIDEYNRTHRRVRNSVMEMVQFGSINGQKISNNWIGVWAAVNPTTENEDGTFYDVEQPDHAQLDRFQIQVDYPHECELKYFRDKYPTIGELAINYWNELPEKLRPLVSPRRLDAALDYYLNNGDIRDMIPYEAHPDKLLENISQGDPHTLIAKLMKDSDVQKKINNSKTFDFLKDTIINNTKYLEFFLPLLNKERVVGLCSDAKKENVVAFLTDALTLHKQIKFVDTMEEILKASADNSVNEIFKIILNHEPLAIENYNAKTHKEYSRATGTLNQYSDRVEFADALEKSLMKGMPVDELAYSLECFDAAKPNLDDESEHVQFYNAYDKALTILLDSNSVEDAFKIINKYPNLKKLSDFYTKNDPENYVKGMTYLYNPLPATVTPKKTKKTK
jgi:MoxR-like ATPase